MITLLSFNGWQVSFETRLFEYGVDNPLRNVAPMIWDCNFSRFGWMLVLYVKIFKIIRDK